MSGSRGVLDRLRRLAGGQAACRFDTLDDASFVDLAYRFLLGREADTHGRRHFLDRLQGRQISREIFLATLIGSQEFERTRLFTSLGPSLHASRCRFVRSLPAARRIVDIGGSCQDSVRGAMVEMGYPYPFESLTVVDLPNPERHALYRSEGGVAPARVDTGLGPVHYLYQSMTSLQPVEDASIDLVYSGQSIEHVTPQDARRTLAEVLRVLRPGGHFALDTPNARVTRLQQDALVDPDHELEYHHAELSEVLRGAGFEIEWAAGLNYAGDIRTRQEFSAERTAANCGVYAAIEDCYLLAYVCRKP